jgi:hypothetical protein
LRFGTFLILVALQITLLVITLVSIGRQPDFSSKNQFLFTYLIPMTIVYGCAAVITIPLDAYWTISVYHYAKEGKALENRKLLNIHRPVPIKSQPTTLMTQMDLPNR